MLLNPEDAAEANEAHARPQPEVSIIIPTFNTAEKTARCVESLACAEVTTEIVIVDNGSTDDTVERVEAAAGRLNLAWVMLGENKGFAAGCNAGAAVAEGRHLVFLNSDTVVTPGWDAELVSACRPDPAEPDPVLVAASGAMSNNVTGMQRDPSVPYNDGEGLLRYAAERRAKNRGRRRIVPILMGFCLCIPRYIWDRVGGFDETFFPGNFDDNDWCERAKACGFALAIAPGAYVWHEGQATFRANGIDHGQAMQDNFARYEAKHGPIPAYMQRPVVGATS